MTSKRPIRLSRSLRVRAFIVTILVAIAPLAFVAGSSLLESNVGERMQENVAAAAAEVPPGTPTDADLDDIARRRAVRLQVLDAEGAVIAQADRDAEGGLVAEWGTVFFGPDGAPSLAEFDAQQAPLAERPEFAAARANAEAHGCVHSEASKLLVCHVVVRRDATYVHAQESSRRAIRALYDLRYQLLKLTLIVVPVALALGWWLGWRMVRPIERLRSQALGQIKTVRPGVDLQLERPDEFGELTAAFNQLLAELRARSAEKEAFVADLAHEFKNPVAAIRACAETMGGDAAIEPKRAERLRRVLGDSSARLDRLVSQFLELARAEAGMAGEDRAEVDLEALGRGLVQSARDDDRFAEIDFRFSAKHAAKVRGVPTRLESAVRNLIENAASFASSTVDVRVRGGMIEVEDDGPGILAEDLPHVFDRFFTKRASGKGTGLGLALVQAIAQAHGGRATATSTKGEGSTFAIELPAPRDQT